MADDELLLATGDQQPNATPAEIEFARRWRDMSKVVFSSTIDKVDWHTRLVTGDAVAEITRLKAEDGGPMDLGGATLAGAVMRAGLIDEYVLATTPAMVGGGTPSSRTSRSRLVSRTRRFRSGRLVFACPQQRCHAHP